MARQVELEQQIAAAVAEVHGEWYGRGPSTARAFVTDELVVVLLEETFTPAEAGLIKRDRVRGIQEIRREWQRVKAEDLKAIVTQATGQQVRAFISDTDLAERIAVEVFILAGAMEDMEAFEFERREQQDE